MMIHGSHILFQGITLLSTMVTGLIIDPNNFGSLQITTSVIAYGFMDYYSKDDIGTLQPPYYWWEAGVSWGSLIDNWFYMENEHHVEFIKAGLLAQVGENEDYVPQSQNMTEGNDDQVFWGAAVMAAAERGFPNPDSDQPQWIDLARATFKSMVARWDTENCGGGLRWQIYSWNNGYDYKNTVSNGGLFHLGARLARYTGDDSYLAWCETIYDWMTDIGLLAGNDQHIMVYDGASIQDNCSSLTKLQWTYNAGLLMSGCAYLSNYTDDSKWLDRTQLFLSGLDVFFDENDIMWEAACQAGYNCNNDQRSFKGILSRFMGLTAQLIPETQETIDSYLTNSALAAATGCSGGRDNFTCGMDWRENKYDGVYGLGEQISALEVIQNLWWSQKPPPATSN